MKDYLNLRRPEETNVSARVLDVFYRPQKKPVDQTLGLLAESLERFNPALNKYIEQKEEVKKRYKLQKLSLTIIRIEKNIKTY